MSACLSAHAEQLHFKKQRHGDETEFHYRWRDGQKLTHELSFSYNNKTLYGHFRNFTSFQPQKAKYYILTALKKTAAKVDRSKAQIEFIEHKDSVSYQITSQNDELSQEIASVLEEQYQQANTEFLHKHFYNTLTDKFGRSGVKPDHVRIANDSLPEMTTIASALLTANANLSNREMAILVLSFVQSIPYSTLENRRQSSGAGFNPPLKLLYNNQGDCDSKVTFMASLMSAIYPNLKMAIIYLPEHALLGLQLSKRNDEKTAKVEGRTLLLADPAGPAMLKLGEISSDSEFFINGKQFAYEFF